MCGRGFTIHSFKVNPGYLFSSLGFKTSFSIKKKHEDQNIFATTLPLSTYTNTELNHI